MFACYCSCWAFAAVNASAERWAFAITLALARRLLFFSSSNSSVDSSTFCSGLCFECLCFLLLDFESCELLEKEFCELLRRECLCLWCFLDFLRFVEEFDPLELRRGLLSRSFLCLCLLESLEEWEDELRLRSIELRCLLADLRSLNLLFERSRSSTLDLLPSLTFFYTLNKAKLTWRSSEEILLGIFLDCARSFMLASTFKV